MRMTQHAQARSQQRGIPPLMIDLLAQFGTKEKAGDGALMLFFDKAGRRRVQAHAGPLARFIDGYMNVYVVMSSDDAVITVGHRNQSIHRH